MDKNAKNYVAQFVKVKNKEVIKLFFFKYEENTLGYEDAHIEFTDWKEAVEKYDIIAVLK